ncbi:hypothetical protein BN14_09644 [Rhizoctonia solani AG-1 IB]|uniref:WW domain-containing protein n=1 Tax=Thanatephorus cucumeris (strain AG1-IB / isolate 7/3/14) TaxID=1108050 RepID=M5C7V7_THACB|nr:hypothetical protein BN14_09644 [Rhizoctonia solani AG-1 IB]
MSHLEPSIDSLRRTLRLLEGLPSQANRYDGVLADPRATRTMSADHQSASMNVDSPQPHLRVPDGWIEHTHPLEGRPYYYNSKLRIVTDAPIRHPNQQSSVEWCYAVFREQRKRALPSAANFDVFLDFNGNNTCRVLDPRALSFEEYRVHLERFPENQNHLDDMRMLQIVLAPGPLDLIASEGSASPFDRRYRAKNDPPVSIGTRSMPTVPGDSRSGFMWGTFGRQIVHGLKIAADSIGVVPSMSHVMGEFDSPPSTLEHQEARFQTHLGRLSAILRSYTTGTSFIESIRRTLIEQTHNPTPIPYSRLLNAEVRQRQLEEAIESVRNRTSEFIVNSVIRQESVLERRLWELSERVQALEDKLSHV